MLFYTKYIIYTNLFSILLHKILIESFRQLENNIFSFYF